MARIRSIKPEFPQSESIGALSRDARLLFIQLWTIVDDDGRARAASRLLASLLYPYDDDAPRLLPGWLTELEQKGCVRLYEVNGSQYIDIPNWHKHQKIDHKSTSRLPGFDEGSRVILESSRSLAPDLGPRTLEGIKSFRTVADATRPSDAFDEFWGAYPKRDGANPKTPAAKVYRAALKAGATAEEIREGLRRYIEKERRNIGTSFIPQAVKWLRNKYWEGLEGPEPSSIVEQIRVVVDTPPWHAWQQHLRNTTGKGSPCVNDGWYFPTEWPPNHASNNGGSSA